MATINTDTLFARANTHLDPEWSEFLERTGLLNEAHAVLIQIEKEFCAAAAPGMTAASLASVICPTAENIFAFARFSFSNTKVIIIGQDPYPNRANAHGLAFSVPHGIAIPPSERNIFSALISANLMPESSRHKTGNLEVWAQQGVILLNTALTTIEGKPGAHVEQWNAFTHHLAAEIGRAHPGLIYLLFGKAAQQIERSIPRMCVGINWGHPSPQSPCNNDPTNPKNFIFCPAFRVANNMLIAAGKSPIDWNPSATEQSIIAASIAAALPRAASAGTAATGSTVSGHLEEIVLDVDDPLVSPDDNMLFAFVDGAARKNGMPGASAGYATLIINSITAYQIVGTVGSTGTERIMPPTNNRAELMALRDLFAFMSTNETFIQDARKMPITIVYDSEYAAGCVREWYAKWCKNPPGEIKANLDIISVAYDFKQRVESAQKIIWRHTKSHLAEPADRESLEWYIWVGNARVDELAQHAAEPESTPAPSASAAATTTTGQ